MPFKNLEEKRAYHSAYNKNLTVAQRQQKALRQKAWWKTDYGQYKSHQRRAQRSGIPFEISFEDWLTVWKESGHYGERSPTGFVMCRKQDLGAYTKDNVYIATAAQNKKDAWYNNRVCTPTGLFYKDTQL